MQRGKPARTMFPRGLFLLAIAVLITITGIPVMADYLGPDREDTTWDWERARCTYEASHPDESNGCILVLYYPPSTCPVLSPLVNFGYFNTSVCTHWSHNCAPGECSINVIDRSIDSCSSGETGCTSTPSTITYPPATVSSSLICSQMGNNGWCTGACSISITASEPLIGYEITIIEGTRNGESFSCLGSSCIVPVEEGEFDFEFWALSNWGDSSSMGSASASADRHPPQISGSLDGIKGDNGWYVSEVIFSASAVDTEPGSGLFQFDVTSDGSSVSLPVTLLDGSYSFSLVALDNAGWQASQSVNVKVDTMEPAVTLTGIGWFCPGCGESLSLTFSATDGGSGIDTWLLDVDGRIIRNGSSPTSETLEWNPYGIDTGEHIINIQAIDQAGNTSTASLVVMVYVPTITPGQRDSLIPGSIEPQSETTANQTNSQSLTSGITPTPVRQVLISDLSRTRIVSSFNSSAVARAKNTVSFIARSTVDEAPQTSPLDSGVNIFFGPAAAGLIGAATLIALENQRHRKEDIERRSYEAERHNADARSRESGYKDYADLLKQEMKAAEDSKYLAAIHSREFTEGQIDLRRTVGVASQESTPLSSTYSSHNCLSHMTGPYDKNGYPLSKNADKNISHMDLAKSPLDIKSSPKIVATQGYYRGQVVTLSKREQPRNSIIEKIFQTIIDFYVSLTLPSQNYGPIFTPAWGKMDVVLGTIGIIGQIVGEKIFGSRFSSTVNAVKAIFDRISSSTVGNVVANGGNFILGATTQYFNDISFGLSGRIFGVNWENGSEAFQMGCDVGRFMSSVQGAAELIVGGFTAIKLWSTVTITSALTLAGSVPSGGTSLIVGPLAITGELTAAAATSAIAAHGGAVLAYNASVHTLRSQDQTLHYGSNTGNTSRNARILRRNMEEAGIHAPDGATVHHIAAGTSQYDAAVYTREILERFHIDINSPENGVFISRSVNSHLNNRRYMDAVYQALQEARNRKQAIEIIDDIRQQVLLTGDYP